MVIKVLIYYKEILPILKKIEVLSDHIKDAEGLEVAMKDAAKYYLTETGYGKEYSNKPFTWFDFFESVPDDICEKFGFREYIHPYDGTLYLSGNDPVC